MKLLRLCESYRETVKSVVSSRGFTKKKVCLNGSLKRKKKPSVVFVRHGDFPVFEAEARQLIVC